MRHRPVWQPKCVRRSFYMTLAIFDQFSIRNVAEQLVEKGYASVVRHKRDDEDRSSDYDKLMAAEQTYADSVLSIISASLNFFSGHLLKHEVFIPGKTSHLPSSR